MNNSQMITALTLGACLCATASAGEKVDKRLEADPQSVVLIENVRGDIEVSGWDKHEVSVEGTLDDMAEALEFKRDGKLIHVIVELPDHDVNRGDGSKLHINVPTGSRVEFKGVSSSATLDGFQGGANVRTVSGDINLAKLGGELSIKSVSGDVRISKADGSARIKSVSGDMKLEMQSREISLATVSGDLTLEVAEFDSLSANSVSGDLNISGVLRAGGQLEAKTVSGDCAIHLKGKVNARASIKTGPGGSITNKLSGEEAQEVFPAQERLETTFGDGTGNIVISTISGDVVLDD